MLLRRKLPPPASSQVYELTPWGYESEPIFQALGRWAARSPSHDPSLPLSSVSLFLSFRAMFDAARAAGREARIGFRLGEETFVVQIEVGRIEAGRAALDGAAVVFTGTAPAVAAAVYGGQPLEGLEAAGALSLEGDHAVADWFVALFPLPAKVSRPA